MISLLKFGLLCNLTGLCSWSSAALELALDSRALMAISGQLGLRFRR